jgi:NodT family efflux transporter outer membrane factor (OMF) lipoprotein
MTFWDEQTMKALRNLTALMIMIFALFVASCTTLGPDFVTPPAPVAEQWLEQADPQVQPEEPTYRNWWQVFGDPVLDELIQTAYAQNLTLRIAGARVFEARALLGIAVGELYPQVQQGFGSATYNRLSEQAISAPQAGGTDFDFSQVEIGAQASWELDFWGKYRRFIESADAGLAGAVAAYDDVLVSLAADVANTYILIRTFEERLQIARENLDLQQESLRIARARYEAGATSERDVQQALTQLNSTEATIPEIETGLRKAKHALCILLGMPPRLLEDMLAGEVGIPRPPLQVAVGIPADLLRRRPDIRNAEYQAAAQSALIGVAKADLYPSFSLGGSFGFLATDVGRFELGDLLDWSSRTGFIGPSFQWNIFNYGRIRNNVRAQDARLQQLLFNYQDTVLRAQQEVEDGLVAFLKGQQRVALLSRSVDAARRTVELAAIQYREGATDYTTVLTAQQSLLGEEDRLALTQGGVPQALVALYRALGGGWELRENQDFLPKEIKEDMEERTDWGGLLNPAAVQPLSAEQKKSVFHKPDW